MDLSEGTIEPLERLRDILRREAGDQQFRDRVVVGGGLAAYASAWRQQALDALGEGASPWVDEVVCLLEQYSSVDRETRPSVLRELLQLIRQAPRPQQRGDTDAEGGEKAEEEPLPPELGPQAIGEGGQRKRSTKTGGGVAQARMASSRRAAEGRGLDASVTVLSGVSSVRASRLKALGVRTIRDLIHHYPHRYEDFSRLVTINHLEYGELTSVLGTVWSVSHRKTRAGRDIFQAILSDHTGTLQVTWFNQPYLERRIKPGMQLLVSGKVDQYLGRLTMNAPQWEIVGRGDLKNARIQPVYPVCEGITQRWLRGLIERTLRAWAERIPDPLPEPLREAHGLLPLARALWGIHFPESQEHLRAARRRLAFEEMLYLQLGLLRQRLVWQSQVGRRISAEPERLSALMRALPYELTGAQQRSLREMLQDLESGTPMNRLLQGDVGAGKTVVAALLMTVVADAGFQAALMAPTEILAEQHYRSLSRLFASFPEPRPATALLTGSVTGVEREAVYQGLADGSIQVVVGTQALIQEAVRFHNLALAVIDEQHRFGVAQRGLLRAKGQSPHVLVMTATPIPRSLALTVWGHMDVSVLDEMPPGRQPIRTRVLRPLERERAYAFIRNQIRAGRQAFIIYPLVEESEKIEARAATEEYERLQREVFPDLRLGLLHGRLRSEEKDMVMSRFVAGEIDILVATSVVEVGVDVPNATVLLIDGADRFGLAQLHQFRGRVGRGEHQSYCLLLAADNAGEEALERLRAVEATNDGFELAEKDLQMRGPGEFLGTQQSGFPELPLADFTDLRLLHEVRNVASDLLAEDPELERPEYRGLRERVSAFWRSSTDLS